MHGILTANVRRLWTKTFGGGSAPTKWRMPRHWVGCFPTDWEVWVALASNTFWCISKATQRSILHLYADDLSSSNSVSCTFGGKADVWGNWPPPQLRTTPGQSVGRRVLAVVVMSATEVFWHSGGLQIWLLLLLLLWDLDVHQRPPSNDNNLGGLWLWGQFVDNVLSYLQLRHKRLLAVATLEHY